MKTGKSRTLLPFLLVILFQPSWGQTIKDAEKSAASGNRIGVRLVVGSNLTWVRKREERYNGGIGGGTSHVYGQPEPRSGASIGLTMISTASRPWRMHGGLMLAWHSFGLPHDSYYSQMGSLLTRNKNVSNRYNFLGIQLPLGVAIKIDEAALYCFLLGVRPSLNVYNRSRWTGLQTAWEGLFQNATLLYTDRKHTQKNRIIPYDVALEAGISRQFVMASRRYCYVELRYYHGLLKITEYPTLSQQTVELTVGMNFGYLYNGRKRPLPSPRG